MDFFFMSIIQSISTAFQLKYFILSKALVFIYVILTHEKNKKLT